MSFAGKTAIITGAGRGIGKSIAEKFATMGANLVLMSSSEEIEKTADEFQSKGVKVLAVRGSVSSAQDVARLVEGAVVMFGSIDVLVNNAGITKDNLLVRMTEKDWEDVLDINLKGAFLCTKAVSKIMMKQRFGKIINITSVAGIMGNPGQANYCASKAGMIGFTKSVAKELASRGITCNAVAPGLIQSKMTDVLSESVKEGYLSSIPLKRFGTTEEVSCVVAFLASEQANYITGQVINIDGGLVM